MADHLPEDPRDWPHDPFRLLGVEPTATETEVKRAYTRLIRRYKPEHAPEQFRKVREAYEAALERAKWQAYFTTPAEPTPAAPEPAVAPPDAPQHVPRDPADEAWSLATDGKPEAAYSQLIELGRGRPEDADVALRLYWLLAVQPSLDDRRTRHDWLAAALRRGRLLGPAVELYRRELEAAPDTAVRGPYLRVLETDASPGPLLWVARQRLAAAGPGREWEAVDTDLAAMGTRATEFDEAGWLSYLVAAMGFLGFDYPAPAYNRCRALLSTLRHLELRHQWAFDQLEEQELMVRVWGDAELVPLPLMDVVRDAWSAPGVGWRRAMSRAAAWVRNDPATALKQIDQAAGDARSQMVMQTFRRVLDARPLPPPSPYPAGLIRGLVRGFLARPGGWSYHWLRGELLRFLLDEAIDPDELVQACAVDAHHGSRSLVECVRNDPVLRLVWLTATAGRG